VSAGTWLKLVRNSTLAATLVTAAQVGIGSGVGIIDWQPGLAGPDGWRALLTWVVFMFAVGTLGGAAVGQRFVPVRLRPLRPFQRFTAAAGAAFGALLALAVVWLPVSVAHTSVSPHPELTVALAAGIGVLLGIVVALLGLVWGGVTAGAALTVGWVWLLAVASALLSARNHAAVTPGLGLLDAPAAIPPSTWWSGPFLMVGLSAIFGLFVAAVSAWRGAHWPGVALSGMVGPTLIAAAYLTTGWALAMAGLTASSGAAAPVVAALVAAVVGLIVSTAVAAPQQRRNRIESFGSTPPRPVAQLTGAPAIEPRRPLAITSAGEKPYEPIYLAPTRSGSSPVTVYSADPYSSDAFEVSSRAFDTVSVPPPRTSSSRSSSSRPPRSAGSPAPVVPPTPPSPSRPAPKGPAVPPAPARPPAPGYAAASSAGAPVSAYPGGANIDVPPGLFAPVPAPPVGAVPTPRPSIVEPSRLVEQGYASPAGPSEPGFDERVYRMPAPGSSSAPKPLNETKKAKGKRGSAASPAPATPSVAPAAPAAPFTPSAPATPAAPAAAARGSVPSPSATRRPTPAVPPAPAAPPAPAPAAAASPAAAPVPVPAARPAPAEPTLRVPPTMPTSPPSRSPVADPPANQTARPAPAAGPAPSQPTTRRARKQARAAAAAAAKASAAATAAAAKASAAATAAQAKAAKASAKAAPAASPAPSPLRAGSIEGEVLSESTQPTSGGPAGRRGRAKDRPLRKGEREHIDWVTNLVQIEPDSVLKTSKER
jgi:hypothetical protein